MLIYNSTGFGDIAPLKGGGVFAIGQKMNSLGGSFDVTVPFTGKLCQLNIWDRVLDPEDIKERSSSCLTEYGTIINWNDLRKPLNGQAKMNEFSKCKSLRNGK